MHNGLVIEVEPGRFEEMVAEALDGLPPELGRLMRNVAVTVEHNPGPRGLLGLYQGIPLTSRTSQYAGVLPDRITIYRQAICAICRTEAEVANQVRRTVIHEIAHHFGIDDDRLRELGWLRRVDGQGSGASHVETRYREEYHSALRTQVAPEERTQNRQQATEADTWAEELNTVISLIR